MLNKLIPRSPIGIALTAASMILAFSPEARKFTRKAAVKGMAGVLSLVDQVKSVTVTTKEQMTGFVNEVNEARTMNNANGRSMTLTYNTDIEPVDFEIDTDFSLPAYNVVSDDFLKKQAAEAFPELH